MNYKKVKILKTLLFAVPRVSFAVKDSIRILKDYRVILPQKHPILLIRQFRSSCLTTDAFTGPKRKTKKAVTSDQSP